MPDNTAKKAKAVAAAIQRQYPRLTPAECLSVAHELVKLLDRGIIERWEFERLSLIGRNRREAPLGAQLRSLRLQKGLTLEQAAERLGWPSHTRLSRIETGDVGIVEPDLRRLLRLYDVTDEVLAAKLLELAGRRRRRWLNN